MREGHAVDANPFLARSVTRDDRDGTLGYPERVGKDLDQLGVGCAFDRRRGQADEHGIVPKARDSRLASPRDDADVEDDARPRTFNH